MYIHTHIYIYIYIHIYIAIEAQAVHKVSVMRMILLQNRAACSHKLQRFSDAVEHCTAGTYLLLWSNITHSYVRHDPCVYGT